MKLSVIGGGSSYTPELISGVIDHHSALEFDEICLMDTDEQRVHAVAGLARRMLVAADLGVSITTTTDLDEALDGAVFVNNLIRVGGQAARLQDERIPFSHGVIGQETTGPGGMMKALRTIPVVLDLADRMAIACPSAWLINYTNPAGIIAEALGRHARVRYVGLCGGPISWIDDILRLLGADPVTASVDWVGLNHLGFAVAIRVDGSDVTEQAIDAVADEWQIDGDLIRCLGAIPASYLRYYYHRDRVIEQAARPGNRLRAERVSEIESELLRAYADERVIAKPALLNERGGRGYASVAMAAMKAVHLNTGDRQIIQTANRGAIDGIDDDAAVEISCVVDAGGPHPLRFGPIPLPIRGLIQSVKSYESLTVEAAVQRDRRIALQAMMAHPLVPSWDVGKRLFDDLAAANARWLPWMA